MSVPSILGAVSGQASKPQPEAVTRMFDLSGGWTIGVPLVWTSRRLKVKLEHRAWRLAEVGGSGLHWGLPTKEDIAFAGLLPGGGDQTWPGCSKMDRTA